MRTSKPDTAIDEITKESIEGGKNIIVRDYSKSGNRDLRVRSLKRINRTAYDAHLVELEIGEKRVRVNIEDLRSALKYT